MEKRPAPDDRPWVMTNMVASLDGATAVGDVSGGLGRPADKEQFVALRSVADAILVGSSTVQSERYRPPQLTKVARAARLERNQSDRPTIVVVSSRLSFDLDLELFSSPDYRPIVATTTSAADGAVQKVRERADVIIAGDTHVDFRTLLAGLAASGVSVVLSEGGPTINDQLVHNNLVDEWNLSISPLLVGGPSRRTAQGPLAVETPTGMRLNRIWHGDDMLFGRWVRI